MDAASCKHAMKVATVFEAVAGLEAFSADCDCPTEEGLHGRNILHSLRVHSCASMLNNMNL